MKIMMDKMCFKQTTQEITISPHIIICPWRLYCITTLASLKVKVIMFWQIQSRPVYILFNNKSQNCFVDNRCITRRLKKSNHRGTKPNAPPLFFLLNCQMKSQYAISFRNKHQHICKRTFVKKVENLNEQLLHDFATLSRMRLNLIKILPVFSKFILFWTEDPNKWLPNFKIPNVKLTQFLKCPKTE